MLLKTDKYWAIITEVQNSCFFPAPRSVNPEVSILILSCLKAENYEEELWGFYDCAVGT